MGRLILLCSLLLIGCSPYQVDPRSFRGIESDLVYYVNIFESLYGNSITDPSVSFSNLPFPQVGLCKLYSTGYWEVVVDKTYWKTASHESRMGLILHELGHCVLKRGHDDSIITDGADQVPKSLMYPYNFYNKSYTFMWNYYSKELFNPGINIKNKTITIVN